MNVNSSYAKKETKQYNLPLYLKGPIHLNFSQSCIISPNNPKPSTRAEYDSNFPPSCTLTRLASICPPNRTCKTAVRGHLVPCRYCAITSPEPAGTMPIGSEAGIMLLPWLSLSTLLSFCIRFTNPLMHSQYIPSPPTATILKR